MGDERLRALERRWRESGSTEDEAAWLAERLRTGSLLPDRLRLAAHCGHPAASLLLGMTQPGLARRLIGFVRGGWLLPDLRSTYSKVVTVRALILVVRLVARDCAAYLLPDERPVQAIQAAETWVAAPTTTAMFDRAAAAANAADESFAWFSGAGGAPPPGVTGPPPTVFGTEQLAAIQACAAPANAVVERGGWSAGEAAAVVALRFFRGGRHDELQAEVQDAIRMGLSEWALGSIPR